MVKQKIKSGTLLLADPFMLDVYFRRAVILVCDVHSEGTLGFILNKPLDVKITDIVSDFPEFDNLVYYGGPVQTDTVHFLHNLGDLIDDSIYVSNGVYWGGDFEKLKILIEKEIVKPEEIKFFVGYSGWSKGQLIEELDSGSWVVHEMDSNYLFKTSSDNLWQTAMDHKGSNHAIIGQMPDNLNLN